MRHDFELMIGLFVVLVYFVDSVFTTPTLRLEGAPQIPSL